MHHGKWQTYCRMTYGKCIGGHGNCIGYVHDLKALGVQHTAYTCETSSLVGKLNTKLTVCLQV